MSKRRIDLRDACGGGQEVELVLREYHSVAGLPPKQRGVLYVVLEKTAMAVPERDDLVVPAQLKKNRHGKSFTAAAWRG